MAEDKLFSFNIEKCEEINMDESFEQIEYLSNNDNDDGSIDSPDGTTKEEEEDFAKYLLGDEAWDENHEADNVEQDPRQDQSSANGDGNFEAETVQQDQSDADGGGNLEAENTQQDQSDADMSDTHSNGEKVFVFPGVFCRKFYGSQQRPREFQTRTVSGNSLPEVLDSIWEVAKKQVHRAVIFENEMPRWADDDPKVDDIQQFVTLQDAQKKKLYHVSSLTPKLLRNWRDKTIKIIVYSYSSNVENNTQYQLILKKLIVPQNPDRSGANSTLDESILANELRNSHPDIEGHQSSWLLWANFISSSPVHEHDKLKASKAPPLELSKFFRWTPVSEVARLQSLHRGIMVAQTVNDGWSNDLGEVKREVDQAMTILGEVKRGVDLTMTILQGVAGKINVMETRAKCGTELFSAMSSATQPEETEISRKLSDKVMDCPDVDHQ